MERTRLIFRPLMVILQKTQRVWFMVWFNQTASMLMLTCFSAGFNFIIHLSSDKESLRDQTQDRINKLFSVGTFESKLFITPTNKIIQAFNKEES